MLIVNMRLILDLILNQIKNVTYLQSEVNMALNSLQAGIDRRVLINAVDINGKLKTNATSNHILKIQRVDGSLLYDALEL